MIPPVQEDRSSALHDYARLKLELADMVRALLRLAEQRCQEAIIQACRGLLARLAEDRFNLAILGQFSRGKSSLMNALLGEAKLPTGALPLTSVVTTVAYGDSERVLLQREGWAVPQEIPLERLPEFITQAGNPGNEKNVVLAEIQLPNELLRLGVHFLDTPGIGSAVAANSRTTRQFLPRVDAAILVTSVESPLAGAELEFLAEIREHARAVFVVVNKQDLLALPDRAVVLDGVRAMLHEDSSAILGVFMVSARDALQAKRDGSSAALLASGWPAFETALADYLRHRKARDLLLRAAAGAAGIVRQQQLGLQIAQRSQRLQEAAALRQRLDAGLANLGHERETVVRRLRGRLRLEFPRRCREEIGVWDAEMALRFDAVLRAGLVPDPGAMVAPWEGVLRHSFQRLLLEWLGRHRPAVDAIFQEIVGAETGAIAILAANTAALPADVLAAERDPGAPPSPAPPLPILVFPEIELPSGLNRPPWWYETLPAGRVREIFFRRWLRRMPGLVRLYQGAFFGVMGNSVEVWSDSLDRGLRLQIAAVEAQVRAGFTRVPEAADISALERILVRIGDFTRAVARMETGGAVAFFEAAANTHPAELSPCSICERVERTVMDGLARFQYDLHVSEAARREHAGHFGFCPLHTWQYEAMASPQGVCAAYSELLSRLAERLRSLAADAASAEALEAAAQSLVASTTSCPACQWAAAAENLAVRELAARAGAAPDPAGLNVCMLHLPCLLQVAPDAAAAVNWMRAQAGALERLAEDMRNYALKHDAIRRALSTGAERRAAVMGLARLVGRRGVVVPWRSE